MSDSQVSILPTHHQPSTGPRTAPTGPFRPSPRPATPRTTSSAALSAGPSSSGILPAALPLPESRTSSPTSTTREDAHPSTTAAASLSTVGSNRDSQITARESSDASPAEDDPPLPPGYPQLARKMGEMPEVAIFRRFGALNAQMLLYMQAELVSLEKQLHRLQARDAAAPEPRSMYAVSWFRLRNSEDLGEGDDDEQWELVKEIRVKLKEYNKMLIQQRKIVCVDPPGSWDLRHMQRYLVSEDMDHGVLLGQDANVWGTEARECDNPNNSDNNSSDSSKGTNRCDLLPLAARHNEDFFSSWVTESMSEKLIKLKKRRQGRKAEVTGQQQEEQRIRNLDDFADKKVLQWTFMVASVLASALPILAIVILYYVQSLKVRLGLIAVFNVLVSFALACFTSAKRAEVFAVSAAFSAVQVVFVQVGANDT